ncbi:F-box/RNI-like/FBD-like domains-containing protein [Rhynchospora pubera]|uniref:F-box/RNI-like/FBD-like domains-containing protein n=1 Tax=Rhynchospora pubera TaxID=906938 RepID=A0AAV8F830_9POAL|nr:F-box/RNI-like/FBD-like domains-containing protein [Rhynchospora pubera]
MIHMTTQPTNTSKPSQHAVQPDDDGWITVSKRRQRKADAERRGRIACEVMINNLPNSILVHILSFLPTTQAAQTCVLSRRWRYLWAYIPTLIIDEYSRNKAYKMKKFLQLCRSPYLRNVSLELGQSADYQSCFKWLEFAMKHKDVEELSLEVSASSWPNENLHYSLPRNIFSHSQFLRVLVLYGCKLQNIGTVDLRNARKLSFEKINVVGNSLNDLLASCTRVEILQLKNSDSVTDLSANLPELKTLILICDGLKFVKLIVPKMEVVKFQAYNSHLESFLLSGMVDLMEAYIDLYGQDYQGCPDLLQYIGQAKQLTIECSSLEMMFNSSVIADYSAIKVMRFELKTWSCKSNLLLIPALLKLFPNLEEFKLHHHGCRSRRGWFSDVEAEEASTETNYGDNLPVDCSLQCLKRISYFNYSNEKQEVQLVKLLVQNAIVLESISFLNCFGDFVEYLDFIEILKTCKASPKAEIIFEDDDLRYPDAKDFRVAIS